jgi:uncharacterized pyridoxamine 5'-phosphate oxidase family protein
LCIISLRFISEKFKIFSTTSLTNSGITLATSAQNKVTARMMSYVNEDLTIYFQTSGNSEKALQIEQNPNIAFAVANIQIEAVARKCGHPMGIKNKGFVKKYEDKFPYRFKSFALLTIV